jgi:hypothetical protein
MPKYFDIIYEDYQDEFSILNAVFVSFLGLFANIMAGVIADKYEKKGYLMTKGNVSALCGLMGIPCILVTFLI